MNKQIYFILSLSIILLGGIEAGFSQEKTVKGNVTDDLGVPLPGATILIENTTQGVTSDFDGNFSINASEGDTLIISYVGYSDQKLIVGASDSYSINLESDSKLDEVIVTAFGVKRQARSAAYATTRVTNKDLTEVSNQNPLQSLSGKIAGVDISSPAQPGASAKILFRGISSITGSNRPLYVVDGSPVLDRSSSDTDSTSSFDAGSGVNDIDPNNIESIDFLKGAAATSLYGSRGANGVILITTKRAKGNRFRISASTSFDFDEVARVPHIQDQFGTGWSGKSYSSVSGEGSSAASNENGSWGAKFNGLVRPWSRIVNNQQLIKPYVFLKNNVREFYEIGNTITNSISLSKNYESSDFALTFSRVDADGVIPSDQDSFKKNTFGLNAGTKIEKLKIRTSINFTHKLQSAVPTGQGDDASYGKSLAQELIQIPNDLSILDLKDQSLIFNTPSYFYTPYTTNPYQTLTNNNVELDKYRWYANINLNYKFSNQLSVSYQVSLDNETERLKRWGKIVNYIAGSPQDNASSQEVVGGVLEGIYNHNQFDTYLNINYNTKINEDLSLDVLLGGNFTEYSGNGLFTSVKGLDLPNYYELSNSASDPGLTQFDYATRTYGFYGQAIFNFKNNYFLTLTARNDYTSTLPIENNSYFYPSVSLAAVVHDTEEAYIKLRGSLARIGNGTDPYQVFSSAGQATNAAYFGKITYPLAEVNAYEIFGRIENQDLKPETTDEIEFGVDARFFNNRIGLDLALYSRATNDLIVNLPVARSTGYATITGNFIDLTNKGIELAVSGRPIEKGDFTWDISYTFTKNKNKVNNVISDNGKVSIYSAYAINFYAEKGKPIGSFYGPSPSKTANGQYIADPETGYYTYDNTEDYLGTSERDFIMGLSNNFSYKNFRLGFSFDWKKGGDFYSYTKSLSHFVGNGIETTYNDRNPWIIPNSVVPDGAGGYKENTTPVDYEDVTAFYNSSQNEAIEEGHVIDRSFMRLRSLSLSYNFDSTLLDKIGISNASISIYGKNLFLWTPAENSYVDPETTSFGNGIRSEFGEFATNPSQRSFGASLKITL